MKNSPEMDGAITVARGVMKSLFANGEREQAQGAAHVFNALINARNATSDFEAKDDNRRRIGAAAK